MNNPLTAMSLQRLGWCRERLEWALDYITVVYREDIADLERQELAAIESKMREIRKELKRLTGKDRK